MTNRRRLIPTFIVAALLALLLPALASAQGNYDPWNRDRDYRRDNSRNNNDYNRYGYDQRALRDSIRRVADRSDDFQNHLNRALDHSRFDNSRREDNINQVARDFRDAADRLKDRFSDGRDLNRSAGEARRLLDIGSRIDRFMSRNQFDWRIQSDWAQIRQDLRVIASAYGRNGVGNYDPYDRRDDWRRNDNRRGVGEVFRNFPR